MSQLDHRQVIAIDGPAAAGKSTVARLLADRIGAMLFDTGALYRAVTLAAARAGISPGDGQALAGLTRRLRIEIAPASIDDGRQVDVLLDGEDVTWAIRTADIDARVSEVSAHPAVRDALLDAQRSITGGVKVVMVGRDIGTVVIPQAGAKIYLKASAAERARRRLAELQGRCIEATFEQVLDDLNARDAYDSSRETAPLAAANDAIVVDTDNRPVEEIVNEIQRIAEAAWRQAGVTGE
ncbi:MAG: (d)CMP kinase [Chloroflexia bacterium]|nr:(d)CMP kinase [Chloroflexia bacterium]